MSGWLRWRWLFDRVLAAIAVVILAPVLAILAAFVHREDRGPGFISLERVGRDGRRFQQWKLRSMRVEQSGSIGAPITAACDSRVTTLGRTLRKWRLDELPQLLNVVRGDMALLGPRPETPVHVDLTNERWQEVLRARPGIAGPTQALVADWEARVVALANDETVYSSLILPLKLEVDRWYVRSASPWIDLLVAAALVRRLFGAPQRSALYRRVAVEVPEASLLLTYMDT